MTDEMPRKGTHWDYSTDELIDLLERHSDGARQVPKQTQFRAQLDLQLADRHDWNVQQQLAQSKEASAAQDRYAKNLGWATWALVLATVVLWSSPG